LASKLFQVKSYLSYWLHAVDEHSLHSPFFFDLYSKVIKVKHGEYSIAETLRKKLLNDQRQITVQDYGSKGGVYQKKIGAIAKASLTPSYYSALYRKIIERYEHKCIIELGTSLGINTLYLAALNDADVTTFEGADAVSEVAKVTFEFAQAKNITLVKGNIDITLPDLLVDIRKVDFALIDANHTYEATIRYFKQLLSCTHDKSMIVVDDIHYSGEMERAWNEIRKHKLVYGSADLYRCGILFFDPSLNKQHVILQF
jgi:predicted O-methyltransferase YrrM